jgi:Na+:H+ antiporter, NhaA family
MPLFALANSGVSLGGRGLGDVGGPVAFGTALGLLIGKPVGILGATALAVKLGIADRPGGAGWLRIGGVSVLAGIGFTVALFIGALAYPTDARLLDEAKVGILLGSAAAGIGGMLLLLATSPAVSADSRS